MTTRQLIKRLWPQSLTAQLVCLLLGAIILTHIVLGVLLAEERRDALASERRGNALTRIAAISRILTTTPRENWHDVLRVAQSPQTRLRLVDAPRFEAKHSVNAERLTARLNDFLATSVDAPGWVNILSEDACWAEKKSLRKEQKAYFEGQNGQFDRDAEPQFDTRSDLADHEDAEDVLEDAMEARQEALLARGRDKPHRNGEDKAPWSLRYLDHFDCHGSPVMQLVVPITSIVSGSDVSNVAEPNVAGPNIAAPNSGPTIWLEAMIGGMMPPPWFVFDNLLRVLLSALVIGVITFFLARRISRSWGVLARAADRVGRGDYPEPVPETGPIEIRRAAKAFNRMTARLKRFVEDRTRMLAAISHDLRTPITSLRLRAEFVDDPENRARIIETLDEMEQMVEAAMAFAREETANEETRKINMTALVESAVEDLVETGRPISFTGDGDARVYPCRPLSVKRAFGNLISNALSFGDHVEVAVRDADDGGLWIEIADDGPGIPVDKREQVFEPFFRIEESRNRDTGGIGLGMAIARTAIRAHGGEIYLEDAPQGGLLARIYLPPVRL
ncbi:MAG: HAMP domain-containing protein [Rhodospirillales bacterium]|nr:HAMP domain-containing protein [Rhodospirillales bacterium]